MLCFKSGLYNQALSDVGLAEISQESGLVPPVGKLLETLWGRETKPQVLFKIYCALVIKLHSAISSKLPLHSLKRKFEWKPAVFCNIKKWVESLQSSPDHWRGHCVHHKYTAQHRLLCVKALLKLILTQNGRALDTHSWPCLMLSNWDCAAAVYILQIVLWKTMPWFH